MERTKETLLRVEKEIKTELVFIEIKHKETELN